jgi:threonine dehydrogenase-like Zn-dependent dehydrogenase
MTDTMLAAVYHGPEDLRLERVAVPAIAEDELLLRVESASICATDLRIVAGGHRQYPQGVVRIPGHEVAGIVQEAGPAAGGVGRGQRVFIAPNMGCGDCRECRRGHNNLCRRFDAFGITLNGAFAQYMRVTGAAIRQGNVIPLPETVDFDAAALAEPLACVLRGQDAVDVSPGDAVLVMGAGPIGLLHVLLARQRGARLVIVSDLVPQRLAAARALGADLAVDIGEQDLAARVLAATGGGADVVIVAAPAPQAMEQAPGLAAVRGRMNYFAGLPKQEPEIRLDANLVHYGELRITGTTACSTADCRRAVALLGSGQIDLRPLIDTRYPLAQAAAAFVHARNRAGRKIVIRPGEDKAQGG